MHSLIKVWPFAVRRATWRAKLSWMLRTRASIFSVNRVLRWGAIIRTATQSSHRRRAYYNPTISCDVAAADERVIAFRCLWCPVHGANNSEMQIDILFSRTLCVSSQFFVLCSWLAHSYSGARSVRCGRNFLSVVCCDLVDFLHV